ncbi:MAG: serine protease [Actinomycetota bacterium]
MRAVSPTPTSALRDRTVRVLVDGSTVGAGFLLTQHWVLTCAHLLEDDNFELSRVDGRPVERSGAPTRVVELKIMERFGLWPDVAMCPVAGGGSDLDFLPIALDDPETDDELVAAGFPLVGGSQEFTTEVGGTISFHGDEGEYIQCQTGWIKRGMSGGPIYSSKRQAVVGFVVGSRDPKSGEGGFFVSLRHVKERWDGWPAEADVNSVPEFMGRPPSFRPSTGPEWLAERLGSGPRRCAVLSSASSADSFALQTDVALSYFLESADRPARRIWLNVDGDTRVLDLSRLAHAIGLDFDGGSVDDLNRSVRRWLEEQQDEWLLVLHGADGVESVSGMIPEASNGRIVVTTQAPPWWEVGDVHDTGSLLR